MIVLSVPMSSWTESLQVYFLEHIHLDGFRQHYFYDVSNDSSG